MGQKQDIAREPVDLSEDDTEFMDTGVLHEGRLCTNCGDQMAARGKRVCTGCQRKS
jgi:hypothetical protein